jgi:long-subunit acyl-CoA synthetase (AMP-forming)
MFAIGCAVGYGSPQTLTDSGLKLAPGTRGDAPTLRPTFMVFAPTVLDRVRASVQAKVAGASSLAQSIFNTALEAGYAEFEAGRIGAPPLWNALAFRKVQALIGGRVTVMISGSAPLSRDTQRFVQTVFACPVRQGYGLTETCSAGTVGAYSDNGWSAGRVLTSCKLKLLDWEEGGYRVADEKDPAIGMPRGEVLIGGPVVSNGYYQNASNPDPELTAKNASDFSVGPDGTRYFHTGDIGQVTPDGTLQIIDRKKDLVKLQMGEYVALSKVENAMKQVRASRLCAAGVLTWRLGSALTRPPACCAEQPGGELPVLRGEQQEQRGCAGGACGADAARLGRHRGPPRRRGLGRAVRRARGGKGGAGQRAGGVQGQAGGV